MKVLTTILYGIVVFAFASCGSSGAFTPDAYESEYISIGNGGGFTGAVTQYYLLKDGSIHKLLTPGDSTEYLGKIEKEIAQQQFASFEKFKFSDLRIDDPGNLYYFLYHNKNDNHIVWGGNNTEVPPSLKIFHTNLLKLIKELNKNNYQN